MILRLIRERRIVLLLEWIVVVVNKVGFYIFRKLILVISKIGRILFFRFLWKYNFGFIYFGYVIFRIMK